jgi:O-antigen/teichoic acid export membrane protein
MRLFTNGKNVSVDLARQMQMMMESVHDVLGKAWAAAGSRLARNAGLLMVGQYSAAGLNLLTNVLMARWLGAESYGTVALVLTYPTLLWSFVTAKSVAVTTRYVARFRVQNEGEKIKAMVKLGAVLDVGASLVVVGLVAVTGPWVSVHVYRESGLTWLMVAYASSFPAFALVGTGWAVLSSWEGFCWLGGFEVLGSLAKLCLLAGALMGGLGVVGVVLALGLAQAMTGVVMIVAASCLLAREGHGGWWRASLAPLSPALKREVAGLFGWSYLLVSLSGLVGQIPVMALGSVRDPAEAGFFRLATTLATAGAYPESALGKVVYPLLSQRWGIRGSAGVRPSLRRWTCWGGISIGGLLLGAALLLPVLVPAVFGAAYAPMVPGGQMIMVAAAVSGMFFWLSPLYYAAKKLDAWTKGYFLYALAIAGLGWFVARAWGFVGMAALVAVSKVAFTLLMLNLARVWGFWDEGRRLSRAG